MGIEPNRRDRPVQPPRPIRVGLWLLAVACAVLALCLSGADESALRSFDAAADRWQHAPDFRAAAVEYAGLGSRAVRAHVLGVPGRDVVLASRSVPFLPKRLAANDTSAAHYAAFDRGPLSAYLYLCGEQSPPSLLAAVAAAGRRADPDAGARLLLAAFHTDYRVCDDAGAVESMRAVLRDLQPSRPVVIRSNVGPLLLPHVRAIARGLGMPDDPAGMTPDQQQAVLVRLDREVRATDEELWRTKQLSDAAAGVWAQVFGPQYHLLTRPLLLLHAAGQIGLIAALVGLALVRRRTSGPAMRSARTAV